MRNVRSPAPALQSILRPASMRRDLECMENWKLSKKSAHREICFGLLSIFYGLLGFHPFFLLFAASAYTENYFRMEKKKKEKRNLFEKSFFSFFIFIRLEENEEVSRMQHYVRKRFDCVSCSRWVELSLWAIFDFRSKKILELFCIISDSQARPINADMKQFWWLEKRFWLKNFPERFW